MVKRWHYLHGGEYDVVMVEDPEGDYVQAEDYDRLAAELAECGRVAGKALGTEVQGNPSQGVVKALADWAGQLCEDKERLAAENAALREELFQDRAVCLCGCSLADHESYGEDGESCEHEDHVCIRVCVSTLEVVKELREKLAAAEDDARGLKVAYTAMRGYTPENTASLGCLLDEARAKLAAADIRIAEYAKSSKHDEEMIDKLTAERDELRDGNDGARVYCEELERKLAAAEAAMQWRPMESAPKDGTSILISALCAVEAWFDASGEGENAHREWVCYDDLFTVDEDGPKGWMPLPPAPGGER